jgi:phosphopantetheinyl transferase (holo-ACP synthase)
MIGNDVVDLRYLDAPGYSNVRYLDRVCSSEEARAVRRSERPAQGLAVIWAAKEAAFKLMSQKFNREHFVPRDFVAALDDWKCSAASDFTMICDGVCSRIRVTVNDFWVHAVATLPGDYLVRWQVAEMTEVCSRDDVARTESVAQSESQAARVVARKLLAQNARQGALEFVGRIPRVKQASGNSQTAISLSHHGAYVAAAIAWSLSVDGETRDRQLAPVGSIAMGEKCFTCTA